MSTTSVRISNSFKDNQSIRNSFFVFFFKLEVVPLRGRYAILAERKDNFFTDVVCGRGDCAGMTYVITSTGLICQFDEHRQMRAERDLQVFLHHYMIFNSIRMC